MGQVNGDFDTRIDAGDDDYRVYEWEAGLPNFEDITPLGQGLIPPELLSAFDIKLEPYRTSGEVDMASEDTISTIRGQSPSSDFKLSDENQETVVDEEEEGSETKKLRRNDSPEFGDSSSAAGKTLKRQRLVWTPQLHKRFVEVVSRLGIKNAVPKTIMNLMNVEGLTRENVASHLQKYRLYLKRMHGSSYDGPSNSLAPASESPVNSPAPMMHIPIPFGAVPMMSMPVPMMNMGNYNGYQFSNHPFNGMMQSGNKYGSIMAHHHHPPHVSPGEQ